MTALAKSETTTENLPTTAEPAANPVMDMIKQAVAAGQPLDVIRELKDMAKELAADESRRAFEEAVAAAKAEIKPIVRRSKGHNGKYADLATIADEVDPIISRHGLSYRHRLAQTDKTLTVTCILSHKSGHREETDLTAGHDTSGNKNPIQALGSTQQYLMRYTLLASLGLSTAKDDDGAGNPGGTEPEKITEAQVKELLDLIERAQTTTEKFCERGKIDAVADLAAIHFDAAKAMLVDRIKKLEARANPPDPNDQFDRMEKGDA